MPTHVKLASRAISVIVKFVTTLYRFIMPSKEFAINAVSRTVFNAKMDPVSNVLLIISYNQITLALIQ